LHWGIIGALGIMANLQGFGDETMALPVAVWLGIVAYNILTRTQHHHAQHRLVCPRLAF
jgi:hypothetical protein